MRPLSNDEEQQAQHIACGHLVTGCERAVSQHLAATGESDAPAATQKRAGEILAQVLSSWRDALSGVGIAEERGAPMIAADNLDRWTGDELLTEAVARSAGDAPALRVMQGLILRALITAHDRAPPWEYANANS